MTMHRTATLIAATALVLGAAGPASAARAEHDFFPEDYDAYQHFAAGEGLCVDWAGRLHEVRHGGYRLVAAPEGQVEGEFHVNGAIEGLIELIPDDPSLPTYAGTYREKVNAVVTDASDDGDLARVVQVRLRSTLVGTDGSSYQIAVSGKTTYNANGTTVVSRENFSCT